MTNLFTLFVVALCSQVHNLLGKVYKKTGRNQQAADEFKAFIRIQEKINPGGRGRLLSAPVHNELSEIYQTLGVGVAKVTEKAVDKLVPIVAKGIGRFEKWLNSDSDSD